MDPAKDADGLHPTNLGRLVLDVSAPIRSPLPCTPRGIVELLRRHDVALAGAHVVRRRPRGDRRASARPAAHPARANATVTLTHTGTVDLADDTRRADVVVAAAGVPGIVTAAMVKPGAAVLDVGITRVERGAGKSPGSSATSRADV